LVDQNPVVDLGGGKKIHVWVAILNQRGGKVSFDIRRREKREGIEWGFGYIQQSFQLRGKITQSASGGGGVGSQSKYLADLPRA